MASTATATTGADAAGGSKHFRTTAEGKAVGDAFLKAFAARDFDALEKLVSAECHFRCLLPPGLREAKTGVNAIAYLRGWFGPTKVEQKQDNGSDYPFLQTTKFTLLDGRVVDVGNPVHCIQYTVELDNRKGHCVCSQTLYFRLSDDNTINKIDLLCGGVNKQSD